MRNFGRGFTLIEIVLVIAVVTVLAGIAAPIYQSFQVKDSLAVATNILAQNLRRAQVLSQASDGDTTWGVKIQSGSITLFKGATYAGRDAGLDEVFTIETSVSQASGPDEIIFAKFTGDPQTAGNIVLTTNTNETKTITLNQKGAILYP